MWRGSWESNGGCRNPLAINGLLNILGARDAAASLSQPRREEIMTTSDIPPTHTINPIDQPPDSDSPTAAMLKADINSGASGDKTEVFDPGMAMLGTCEEASGTPLTPTHLAWARRQDTLHP